MRRIRFHGRGGQGMKTASRILGNAGFLAGLEVQDAPRYGAERRGAPIFADVRVDGRPSLERGIIGRPDLVVADTSLIPVPAAAVLLGIHDHIVLLIASPEAPELWRERLGMRGTLITFEPEDLARKVETALSLKGPRLLLALAPCPTGWDFDPQLTAEIGKLAVKSGLWPLKEYRDGRVVHTKPPQRQVPVERYLETQGRFRHLFEPERRQDLIDAIQGRVDAYWSDVSS